MTEAVSKTEAISEADRDAFAREAFAAIEAALDRRCPEMRGAYWTAVDRLYRRDARPDPRPRAAADTVREAPPPARVRPGSS